MFTFDTSGFRFRFLTWKEKASPDFVLFRPFTEDMGDPRTSSDGKKVVLVTGFGPFEGHSVNASWEAVKELSVIGLLEKGMFELVIMEIPVTYHDVKTLIPKLWHELKPYLVIHVGVSHLAQELTLEQIAYNDGYIKNGADGKMNDSSSCCPGGPFYLKSGLRMDIVSDQVNRSPCEVMAVSSTDAGRYLCEFIYYTSLNQDSERVAFIHVPRLGKPYTAKQLAAGIQSAIDVMLKQLASHEHK